MKIYENYHTHTWRCGHASGDVEDYVQEALRCGITHLGFSDHTPIPDETGPVSFGGLAGVPAYEPGKAFMWMKELPGYVGAVAKAKADHPQLRIFAGLECDYFKVYEGFFRDELLGRWNMDYLAGSAHTFPYRGEIVALHFVEDLTPGHLSAYAEHVAQAMDTGLFDFICHPDLFGLALRRWDEEARACCRYIAQCSKASGVPLEINVHGYERAMESPERFFPILYPLEQFWEIAGEIGAKAVVNSDAHDVHSLAELLPAGYRLMEKYGIEQAEPIGSTRKLEEIK